MKTIFRIAALAVVLAGMGMADDMLDRWRTCGTVNGHYWQEMPGSQRGYLAGVMDTGNETINWPDGVTVGDMRKSLDQFYSDPANIRIPVTFAILLAGQRFRGVPDKTVLERTEATRRYTITCGEPVAKKTEIQ